jgi:aspartate/methionine/tyrosine aminotransferase
MLASRTHIAASATAMVHGLVQDLKRQGHTVYNLSIGEPNLPNAPEIQNGALEAIERNQNAYPPSPGFEEVRETAAAWVNRTCGTRFAASNTLVTAGGKFGIFLSLQALVEAGDEVVLVAPHWVSYPSMIQLFDGKARVIQSHMEKGWKISPEELAAACGPTTKVVILNNACNPTGSLYTREELAALLAVVPPHCWILADEVYSGLCYDGRPYASCGQFEEYADRSIVIQSCSKNFGMTGWRLGFVFAPASFIEVLIKLQGQSITSASGLSQWAALAALQNAEHIQRSVREALEERRNIFIEGLSARFSPFPKPAATLYCFLPLSYFGVSHQDDIRFCKELLEQAHIALVPGTAFGSPGFVRCAFGETPEHLVACLDKLQEYFKKS